MPDGRHGPGVDTSAEVNGEVARSRCRVLVRGRVQGVGFRASCARRARTLGLGGFVRNLSDGAVEAVFEGTTEDVQSLVSWCRHGPGMAQVTGIEVSPQDPLGDDEFRVV